MDLQSIASYNNGKRFALVVVESLSGFVWVRPLKNKTAVEVANQFDTILRVIPYRVKLLFTDKGNYGDTFECFYL